MATGVYGRPPRGLVEVPQGAVQYSPLIPGSERLEDARGLDEMVVLAPPGTVERRHVLALALGALKPGGRLVALAPKDKGGSRLKGDLELFGCTSEVTSKAHHRLCACMSPTILEPAADHAIATGSTSYIDEIGLWTQPGVFSWDRIDPGSRLLADRLPPLAGAGADFGCGIGYLAQKALDSPAIAEMHLVDIDRRAIDASGRNIADERVRFHWADVRHCDLPPLDFVISNPPFHETGLENKGLGQQFIARAAQVLKPGGRLFLVANRHLPYEAVLREQFKASKTLEESNGYKAFEAVK